MSERRNFLKTASLLPLGVFSSSPAAMAAVEAASTPSDDQATPGSSAAPPIPPLPPPIQEQPFPNYHLKGKPDHDASLFGGVRPQDWKNTKEELEKALKNAADADDPIHEWLKTFKLTFDDRATSIVVEATAHVFRPKNPTELKYEPQLYDASLRSASALLDRCLRYRNEMGGFESAGVSAGISYLTFIRLKPLQRNFLVQSNSADLAEIERTTEAIASHKYHQVKGLDRLFEKYQLQAKQVEAAGSSAEAGLAEIKDNFLTELLEKQFHLQIDSQLAEFTRLLTPGSSSNFAERYLRMLSMLTEDLSDAYSKLYSASKGVQKVLNLSKVTVAMNSPIDVDIPLFNTVAAVEAWVDQVVPSQGGNLRRPDVLDALVLWARAVMRELDTRGQYEAEFTVAIPLNQPWGKAKAPILQPKDITNAFGGANPTGIIPFTLKDDSLPIAAVAANIRLVGIGLSIVHSIDDASPVQYITGFPHTPSNPNVAPPGTPAASQEPTPQQISASQQFELPRMARFNATVTTPIQTQQDGKTYKRPPIVLANVRIQGGSGGDSEPVLSYDASCRGLYPFGDWSISVDPNAVQFFPGALLSPPVAGVPSDNWIASMILHLRVRCTLS